VLRHLPPRIMEHRCWWVRLNPSAISLLPSAFLGSDSYPTNRSFLRSLRRAFLVLAGAEEGDMKSNYRVVKINKEKPIAFLPYNGRQPSCGHCTIQSGASTDTSLPYLFQVYYKFSVRVQVRLPAKAARTAFALIALGLTYVCAVFFCIEP